jgi:glutathione peroxidase-family protein
MLGFTDDHYIEMNDLYSALSSIGRFEVVAFPCNQFDGQEPGEPKDIKAFTAQKGVRFRVMDKINVNGRHAHDVYRFLKNAAGPEEIEWNFAKYFVISPDGGVESFTGITPLELRGTLASLLKVE